MDPQVKNCQSIWLLWWEEKAEAWEKWQNFCDISLVSKGKEASQTIKSESMKFQINVQGKYSGKLRVLKMSVWETQEQTILQP